MNGIKMSDCKFYVDKNARVVICVIQDVQDMLIKFVREHFDWNDIDIDYAVDWHFEPKLKMPHSFMGKATDRRRKNRGCSGKQFQCNHTVQNEIHVITSPGY